MTKLSLAVFALLCAVLGVMYSQNPPGTPFRIIRLDPALDDIIAPDARGTLPLVGTMCGLGSIISSHLQTNAEKMRACMDVQCFAVIAGPPGHRAD